MYGVLQSASPNYGNGESYKAHDYSSRPKTKQCQTEYTLVESENFHSFIYFCRQFQVWPAEQRT